ncbi:iron complex outermembrane recepter protein [Novosphingobium sp. CF614]|uniref:TonB-dependent receptor n=1 Tax=Novosphingobium sp. CF614 TaxID=1884364 RepID=UPI0008ED4EFF|nr:TonB-dependent receptor [Novosphingobium sp. CF614]SFG44364.1 iron complex outermembrane recepter protein [Novosphingobium sp. CF614]
MAKASTGASIARLGLVVSASAIALGAAAPAFAQATGDKDGSSVTTDEIIVTAQFYAQNLQDTPIAITAMTGDTLEQRSAASLSDATSSAPSVLLRPQSAAFGDSVSASIRGLGQSDFDPAMEPGVGIYIDDVYYPRLTGANLDLMDVDRVEVLRGPQGTLTGKNAEGGAIKFFSKMPTGENGGYLSATYGSRNRINLRGSADFKLTDDLSGRISGAYASQEGYVNVYDYGCAHPSSGVPSTGGGSKCLKYKEGDVGYQALRGMLRYNPDEKLDVLISGDYTHSSHHNSAQVLLYANNSNPNVATANGLPYDSRFICGPWCNYDTTGQNAASFVAGLIPALDGFPMAATSGSELSVLTSWGVSGKIGYDLSDAVKLTSITSYREFENSFSADGDLSPANVGFGNNNVTDWAFSQELRLGARLGDMINATLGGFYSDEKAVYYTLQDIRYVAAGPLPIFPLQFIGDDPIRTKSRAVYGNVEVTPADNLTINMGLRYTHDSKDYTFYRLSLDGVTPNPFLGALNGVAAAPFRGNRLDYRVALDYRFSPEVMAYASIATGYKAGGNGPRPFNAAQALAFGPEKVTNYEVGVKTDLFDRKLRLNLDVFYLDFKDAQLTLLSCPQYGGPGPCALPQNAGNAHSKGIEAEVFLSPVTGMQIDGSLSYQDWKWTCINPQVVRGAAGACSSDAAVLALIESRPPGMMKWKWSVGAQYQADLGSAGWLTPRIDVAYQGSMIGNVLTPAAGSPSALYGQLDGFTLANARLTWSNSAKDLDVALEVTNLFDKYYYTAKFDLTGAGAGSISGAPGRPREWAVSIKKKF